MASFCLVSKFGKKITLYVVIGEKRLVGVVS